MDKAPVSSTSPRLVRAKSRKDRLVRATCVIEHSDCFTLELAFDSLWPVRKTIAFGTSALAIEEFGWRVKHHLQEKTKCETMQ